MRDPYEVLGVSRTSSADEIKSAYRKLARQYHPDVNQGDPGAEERFKEIGQAYSILSDPERRARFDQFGVTDEQPRDPFFGGGGFGDLFDMFMGGMAGGQPRKRSFGRDGEDIRLDVSITLADVISGVEKSIQYRRRVRCKSCAGSGVEGGGKPDECTNCGGTGVVMRQQQTMIGMMRTQTACPTCRGEGFTISAKCNSCAGNGVTPEMATIELRIPSGIESGTTLRAQQKGHEGTGAGRPGDLFAVLTVDEDERFARNGTELATAVELSIAQAALGDEVEIDGVLGPVSLKVPSGTQPGDVLRVRGEGLPRVNGSNRGDLHVQVHVVIPKRLSEAQSRLLLEFAELSGESIPKGEGTSVLGGIFKRKK